METEGCLRFLTHIYRTVVSCQNIPELLFRNHLLAKKLVDRGWHVTGDLWGSSSYSVIIIRLLVSLLKKCITLKCCFVFCPFGRMHHKKKPFSQISLFSHLSRNIPFTSYETVSPLESLNPCNKLKGKPFCPSLSLVSVCVSRTKPITEWCVYLHLTAQTDPACQWGSEQVASLVNRTSSSVTLMCWCKAFFFSWEGSYLLWTGEHFSTYVNVYLIAKNSVKDRQHEYTATNYPGSYTFKWRRTLY